ncbi:MAG: hypothetical protein LQ351_000528 [Letrouitia transgressa]|nr:MAG: hypothetical protein LQ351_000528 [Letrouitia transgressa]
MEYETENGRYDDEPRYDRGRSASPRQRRDDDYTKREDSYRGVRDRSASPNGRVDSRGPPPDRSTEDREAAARNPGSNLFVTGIHPRLTEADVSRLFEKYGDVEGCSIMKDPHTQESRGFGFVKMVTPEQADAAKEGLQGEHIEGRTLSIEKARRARPRTPTPGKYFGPPKRATALLAMKTAVMAVATITALAALIAMLLDVTTAIAAVETTDAVDQIIMAERADGLVLVVMVTWHHQESLIVEVEAMKTVTIGTHAAR